MTTADYFHANENRVGFKFIGQLRCCVCFRHTGDDVGDAGAGDATQSRPLCVAVLTKRYSHCSAINCSRCDEVEAMNIW